MRKFQNNNGREVKLSTFKVQLVAPQQDIYDNLLAQVGDLLIMQSAGGTDILEMRMNGDSCELRILKQFQYKVTFAFEHEFRLICDNQVFRKDAGHPYRLCQYLQFDEQVLGGAGLKDDILVFGHISYGRVSIFVWRGNEYLFV